MPNKRHLLVIAFLFTILTLGLASTVKAQDAGSSEPVGLSISPPTFEIAANPGDTITNVVRLDNLAKSPAHIMIDKRNFTALGEEGSVGLTQDDTPFALASWLSVTPQEIDIPAQGSHTFSFTIKVPQDAEPGGHFGSIIFRSIPQASIEGSGASLSQEIGNLILLNVAGDTRSEAYIASFATSHKLYEKAPITFDLRVENQGNVHLKPVGTITIADTFGRKVASVPLSTQNILPGATRRIDTSWSAPWLIGRYTATVAFTYDTTGTQRTATTIFTVFPYKLATMLVLVLAIIILILYRLRKRLKLAFKILTTGKT